MKLTSRLLTLTLLTMMILGAFPIHPVTNNITDTNSLPDASSVIAQAGFDSQNISILLLSPTNRSGVAGTFDIELNITSDFAPLNLTLFIEGAIDPSYNKTPVGAGTSWIETLSVDSLSLPEGYLNFTILLEYNDVGEDEKESVFLEYFVDNVGPNFEFDIVDPVNGSTLSGIENFLIDMVSDFDHINFTLYVDGEIDPSYERELLDAEPQLLQIDTSDYRDGLQNFTIVFEYDMLNVHYSNTTFWQFIIDNIEGAVNLYLVSPTNQSQVSGEFNLSIYIGSDYGYANLTMFVEGIVEYVQYNRTPMTHGGHILTLNTTILDEGLLNFTVLLEYNITGENIRVSTFYLFLVNNHGSPRVVFLAPEVLANFIGLDDLMLNISSDYNTLNLTIYVDDEATEEYNNTFASPGVENYTIDGSRYENGVHTVSVRVETEEGLYHIAERDFYFLDYVRFDYIDITNYDRIFGNATIELRIYTPYDNITASLYVDDELVSDIVNITLPEGRTSIEVKTAPFSEGEHNFTLRVYSEGDHSWENTIILIVDNHGIPIVEFIAPTEEVVVGFASFTVEIESTWDSVNVSVYVDDEVITALANISVTPGEYTFSFDTNAYSKWEHDVKVVVTTDEGEVGETTEKFGFANIKTEEVVSLAIIIVIGLAIPILRWRRGDSLKAMLIADVLFLATVAGIFFAVGVNSWAFALWHFNVASIWAIGAAFIFINWLIPLAVQAEKE
ncbi:MAG: hypothetical protein ACFE7R_07340 [Candidatus Hodarchaeota archaeon]